MNIWKHKHLLRNIVLLFIGGILIGVFSGIFFKGRHDASNVKPLIAKDTLVAAFTFNTSRPDRLGYAAGLEYSLLKRFAKTERCRILFLPARNDTVDLPRALGEGRVDILVADSADCDILLEDRNFKFSDRDGICRWVVRKSDRFLLSELDDWLDVFILSEEYRYLNSLFSPFKLGLSNNGIETPYNDIIKSNAKILEWDWRLLVSLIFQESKFLMFAVSPKEASGLMQIKPATAQMYGLNDIFDPVENIRAGVLFLSRLQGMFPVERFDSVNAIKFTLAAYNCGEGRMRDCMNLARDKGLDWHKWENILSVIPEMKEITDSSSNDIVKLGHFNGEETINFVEQILARYEQYCRTEE